MAERIVDALELVDVDVEDRERPALAQAPRASLQIAAQQHAVGQVGQRVVMRHMRDALVGADALGDVLVGRDPAAGCAGLVLDLDQAAVRGLDDGALGCRPALLRMSSQ